MAERKRSRGYQLRERDRPKYQRFTDDDDLILLVSQIPNIEPNLQAVTSTIRQNLKTTGIEDPWLLARSGIYESALLTLEASLRNLSLGYLQNDALEEVYLLSEILYRVFTGQIHFKVKEDRNETKTITKYEGYTALPDLSQGGNKRVSILHRTVPAVAENTHKILGPSCQIVASDIEDRNSKGMAIAGPEAELRCGLTFIAFGGLNSFRWRISVDSGLRDIASPRRPWRSVHPLSQAIHQVIDHEFDPDESYTYHYSDPDTILSPNDIVNNASRWFDTFNQSLEGLFRQRT